ncbi:MAG TPA: DMT family transporter [Steroidobacteraceae bacterium]
MSLQVLAVVLFGAFLHASWNMLVKARPDKHVAAAVLYASSGLIAAVALPFLPAPSAASWPCLAASTVLELLYGIVLATAYRVGDLSHAYPLMRGTAPLLVAAASSALLGERLSGPVWFGIVLLSCALISLVFEGRSRRQPSSATGLALLNAFLIAAYTMIDGVGARRSGDAVSYGLWLFMLIGIPWFLWAAVAHRRDGWATIRSGLWIGVVCGACSLASYVVALWAMTRAPIASVAAIRETSIVFGTILGAVVLREQVTWIRASAACVIAAAVWIIRNH